jgi:hypothetical protein
VGQRRGRRSGGVRRQLALGEFHHAIIAASSFLGCSVSCMRDDLCAACHDAAASDRFRRRR